MKKVVLTNAVALNGGDAAIMFAIIEAINETAGGRVEWTVCGSQPQIARRYFPDVNFKRTAIAVLSDRLGAAFAGSFKRRFQKAFEAVFVPLVVWAARFRSLRRFLPAQFAEVLEAYASADFVISTGGTYLVESYPLEVTIREFELIRRLRRPLVFYTQSLGPFRNPLHRKRLQPLFAYARLILLRDEKSRQHLLDLGVGPEKCVVVPDCVFGLHRDRPAEEHTEGKLEVAVSVRSWAHFKTRSSAEGAASYEQAVIELIGHLVRTHGASVTLLSTCQGIPEYWTDDSKVALRVHERLPGDIAPHVMVDRSFRSPSDLIERLRSFDLAVATRMHFSIMAMIAEVPTIAIAYEFKTAELFRTLGLEEQLADIETVSGEQLIGMADQLLPRLAEARDQLRRTMPRQRAAAISAAQLAIAAAHPAAMEAARVAPAIGRVTA